MKFPSYDEAEALKAEWTDKLVRVRAGLPEYTRFAGMIGRVVTVNYGGRALVDFADGAWYDIPATDAHLEVVTDPAAKHDATANSAQKHPTRQG